MPTYFTVKGTRYAHVPPDDWTFREAREFQRISGMSVGNAMRALAETNTDAYLAWYVVSMQRVDPKVTEHDIAALNFSAILSSEESIEEEPDPEPNPQTASPSKPGGNGDADSASKPTPVASGTPHG